VKSIIATCILLVFFTAIATGQVIDRPAATVNLIKNEFISVKQLEQRIEQYKQFSAQGIANIPTSPGEVLDLMIQEVLIKQAADDASEKGQIYASDQMVDAQLDAVRKDLDRQQGSPVTDQQFQEVLLSQTGLNLAGYKEKIREQFLTQEYIRFAKKDSFAEMTQPTDKQIADQYSKNATSFTNPELVRVSEILIDTRTVPPDQKQKALERAELALRNIRNGEGSFEDMVLQYSDDAQTRYTGGDKGYFARNDPRTQAYGAEFIDALFEVEAGKVSDVIQSNIGYHLVKITDHRAPKLLQLEDQINPLETQTVKEFIRNLLMQEIQNRALQQALAELTSELKERAEIRIFEENMSTLNK
jgi:peptidyl-prolyl cis-trans isomerase SurA